MSLLSLSVLHRHGSRGPGDSELKPWEGTNSLAFHQWDPTEYEVISPVGRVMIKNLGKTICERYIASNALGVVNKEQVRWRCSSSERARESGDDFVMGFNNSISTPIIDAPVLYEIEADNYFRPWKIFKNEEKKMKTDLMAGEKWLTKANDIRDFMSELYTLTGANNEVLDDISKSLWSITYIQCGLQNEAYWPIASKAQRSALSTLIPSSYRKDIEKVALWVWERRFLDSPLKIEMGARISLDMLRSTINPGYKFNLFSGHDYTILGLLSVMDILPAYEMQLSFGAYLLFELWDSTPPPHPSGPAKVSRVKSSTDNRILRILLNYCPFISPENRIDDEAIVTPTVHHEVVQAELSLDIISEYISKFEDFFNA